MLAALVSRFHEHSFVSTLTNFSDNRFDASVRGSFFFVAVGGIFGDHSVTGILIIMGKSSHFSVLLYVVVFRNVILALNEDGLLNGDYLPKWH